MFLSLFPIPFFLLCLYCLSIYVVVLFVFFSPFFLFVLIRLFQFCFLLSIFRLSISSFSYLVGLPPTSPVYLPLPFPLVLDLPPPPPPCYSSLLLLILFFPSQNALLTREWIRKSTTSLFYNRYFFLQLFSHLF